MAVVSSATLLKTPRRMRSAVIFPNQRSTRLSHEDEVGIKWSESAAHRGALYLFRSYVYSADRMVVSEVMNAG
jgi:hypothetical protein